VTHQNAVASHATERYLLDQMSELERYAFESHYFDCAECADDVRAGVLMKDGVKEGLLGSASTETASVASSSVRVPWHRSVVIPWAAAATLALVVGYRTIDPVTGPVRNAPALQALAPVTLRPASRGAVPAITVSGETPLTLALDVNAPAGTRELAYELRGPDKTVTSAGRAAAPATGGALFLLVSPSTFPTEGRYSLAVRDSERAELLGEYAFDVNMR
jgi:hypothetical protein